MSQRLVAATGAQEQRCREPTEHRSARTDRARAPGGDCPEKLCYRRRAHLRPSARLGTLRRGGFREEEWAPYPYFVAQDHVFLVLAGYQNPRGNLPAGVDVDRRVHWGG